MKTPLHMSGILPVVVLTGLTAIGCRTPGQSLFAEGRDQIAQQEYARAYQTFSRYLVMEPGSPDGYYQRALAAVGLKKYAEADSDIVRAIALHPNDTDLRWMRFRLLAARREALTNRHHAPREEKPVHQSMQTALEVLQLAELDQILLFDPDDIDARFERGRILRERGELEGARRDLNMLFLNSSWDPWILNERGMLFHDLGDYDAAVWNYGLALAMCDTCPWLLYNKALSLKEGGHPDKAVEVLIEFLSTDSLDAGAWYLLAECHQLLGHEDEARQAFARSAKVDEVEAAGR